MKPSLPARERIVERIKASRRIDFGTYRYFVWPYKGISPIDPEELQFLVTGLEHHVSPDADLLLTFQTDGEILAVPLALRMSKELVVCRDVSYEMPEPLIITQHTRYWTRNLYCERPSNRNVVIVEAIISTGNTVIEAVERLRDCGAHVLGVVTAVSKVDYEGEARILDRVGIKCSALMRIKQSGQDGALLTEWSQ